MCTWVLRFRVERYLGIGKLDRCNVGAVLWPEQDHVTRSPDASEDGLHRVYVCVTDCGASA